MHRIEDGLLSERCTGESRCSDFGYALKTIRLFELIRASQQPK